MANKQRSVKRTSAKPKRVRDEPPSSEERLRLMVESVIDYAIFMLDPNGRIVSWNAGAERIKGYRREEILGQHFSRFYLPEDIEHGKPRHELEVAAATGRIEDEGWRVRKDGSTFWASVTITALRDESGVLHGFGKVTRDLTAHKLAEDNLTQFRAAVDTSADAIYLIDRASMRFIDVNDTAGAMLGYTREELLNTGPAGVTANTSREELEHILDEVIAQGHQSQPAPGSFRTFQRKDGTIFEVEVRRTALRLDGRDIIVSVARDITEQVRAVRALRESEARFRSLTELSSDWYWEQDENFRFTTMSGGVLKKLGIQPESYLGKTRWDIPTSIDSAALAAHKALLAAHKPFHDLVYSRTNPQGKVGYISVNGVPIFDENGVFRGYRGIGRDVTAEKLAEVALQESEERFRNTLEYAPIGMAIVSLEGKWIQVNRSVCAIVGYEKAELATLTFQDITHPDDLAADLGHLQQLLRGEIASYQMEKRYIRKDGGIVWVQLTVSIMRNDQDDPLYFISQIEDITERKQAEAELRKSKGQLEQGLTRLERLNREAALISDLVGILQVCVTATEAYGSIQNACAQLYPDIAGRLYMANPANRLMESVVSWGDPALSDQVFVIEECWALRRGQVYRVDNPASGLVCKHVAGTAKNAAAYLCAPLLVQGQSIGLLYLEARSGTAGPASALPLGEAEQRLASVLAEQLALGLANIALRETLQNQSIRDPLTGLFNRRFFEELLARELIKARRNSTTVSIIMLDVDHFKAFNDTFGHQAGDYILQNLARILLDTIRQSDMACRLGGEEFIAVLPETSLVIARERAEKLRLAIDQYRFSHSGHDLGRVTVSIGVAMYPDHGSDPKALVRAADVALYEAKGAGRNRVHVAEEKS